MAAPEARQRAYRAFYARRDAAGLCRECGIRPKSPRSTTRCDECLETQNAGSKQRYRANPGKHIAAAIARTERFRTDAPLFFRAKKAESDRKYYARHPEKVWAYELKRRYGLTVGQYEEFLQKQNGCCALCGKPPTVGKRATKLKPANSPKLYVDHCHATGKVRGLLCHWCNGHIIAGIEKSGASLKRIAEYLGVGLD